jgi:hypothetical protein
MAAAAVMDWHWHWVEVAVEVEGHMAGTSKLAGLIKGKVQQSLVL